MVVLYEDDPVVLTLKDLENDPLLLNVVRI